MGYQVTVFLEDGRQYDGDVLVGADGIWSKVGFFPSKSFFFFISLLSLIMFLNYLGTIQVIWERRREIFRLYML